MIGSIFRKVFWKFADLCGRFNKKASYYLDEWPEKFQGFDYGLSKVFEPCERDQDEEENTHKPA